MVVLVIDDNEFVRCAVKNVLRREGHRVLLAQDLAAARRILSRPKLPIALVVSDIELPDGSGLTLVAELAADRPDLPVVISSGAYRPSDPALLPYLGRQRVFLAKPFRPNHLLESIDTITTAAPRRMAAAAAGSASLVSARS